MTSLSEMRGEPRGYKLDKSDGFGPLRPLAKEKRDKARRTAAHYAHDAADLDLLLDALGLGAD